VKKGTLRILKAIDRAVIILCILILIDTGIMAFLYLSTQNLRDINKESIQSLNEMEGLLQRVRDLKMRVQSIEGQIERAHPSGIVKEIEDVLESIGLRADTIRPMGDEKRGEFIERSAFVRMQGVDLNEIVNTLYVFENSRTVFRIRGISIKSTFEDPEKFVLELNVGMITK